MFWELCIEASIGLLTIVGYLWLSTSSRAKLRHKEKATKNLPISVPIPKAEVDLYARQLILPSFGVTSQLALKNAQVIIIGCGGLGSSLIPALAGVGVGNCHLVDFDMISLSNLHRQTLYGIDQLGQAKVECAKNKIRQLNPFAAVTCHNQPLDTALCDRLFPTASLIVDCCDNLPTRLLICDAASKYGCQVVSGSALRLQGHVLIYGIPGESGCYRCLLNEAVVTLDPIPGPQLTVDDCSTAIATLQQPLGLTCEEAGVLGPVPTLIGNMMALECVKLLTRSPDVKAYNFVTFDFESHVKPYSSFLLKSKGQCLNCAHIEHRDRISYRQKDYRNICLAALCPVLESALNVSWKKLLHDGFVKEPGIVIKGVFIDVRPEPQSVLFSLQGKTAYQYPWDNLSNQLRRWKVLKESKLLVKHFGLDYLLGILSSDDDIFVYCRSGNASRMAVSRLLDFQKLCHCIIFEGHGTTDMEKFCKARIFNVTGGLRALQHGFEDFSLMPVC